MRPFYASWFGGLALAGLVACGPAPWWATPTEEPQQEQEPEAATRYAEPERPATRAPSPTTRPPSTAPTEQRAGSMQIVDLGERDTYYLIDRTRRLCFLHHQSTVTEVDCGKIPEARDLAASPSGPRATPPPATTPERGVTRRYVHEDDEGDEHHSDHGHDDWNDGEDDWDQGQGGHPEPSQPAPAPVDRGDVRPPTPDELTRFEVAYTEIFCDRRDGADVPPRSRIEGQRLSVERYGEIEEWWAGDQAAWWALVNKARRGCAQR